METPVKAGDYRQSVTPEELAELTACGCYDPETPWAADRLKALELLLDHGASVSELCHVGEDLGAYAARLSLRPRGSEWTLAELAAHTGMSPEWMARVWRAAGFPDPGPDAKVAGPNDVAVFRAFAAAARVFGEDVVLQMTRVIGSSMARLANATSSAFVVNLATPALSDPSGLAMVQANVDAATLLPPLLEALDQVLRQHMVLAVHPATVAGNVEGYEVQTLCVGFLDLIGSTTLARELPFAELGGVISEFENTATDIVVQNGGRVIKLIGDEVMFTALSPVDACQTAAEVRDALAGHRVLRGIRGGLAAGRVLLRDGDCFGPVVNLAARLVKRAATNEIVVDGEVAGSLRGGPHGLSTEGIGHWEIEGFDLPIPASRLVVGPGSPPTEPAS